MAKKSSIEKNKHRRQLAKQLTPKRERLLAVANDESKPMEERFEARLKLAELPRNGAAVRIKLRCALTGRARGNYRKFKLSRNMLRSLANSGQLPGVVKASW